MAEAQRLRRRLLLVLRWGMTLGAVAVIAWLVIERRVEFAQVLRLSPLGVAVVLLTIVASFVINAVILRDLTARFGVTLPLLDATLLCLAGYTLNYLPMKSGTIMQGAVMRVRYRVPVAHFAALSAGGQLATLWTTTAIAGAFLLASNESVPIGLGLLVVPSLGMGGLILWGRSRRLDPAAARTRAAGWLVRAVDGLLELMSDVRLVASVVFLNAVLVLLQAARLYVVFGAIGSAVAWKGSIVVSAVAWVAYMFSVIPGGLGFREGGVAAGAAAVGLTASAGLSAALVDRGIDLLAVAVLGVPAALYLSRVAHVPLVSADEPRAEEEPAPEGAS